MQQLDPIGSKFLNLELFFDRQYPYVLEEQPTLTGDNLLAQLGGMLSLWLGITIMTAVEFIELLYTIIGQWIQRRRSTGSATTQASSDDGSPTAVSTRL